MTKTAKTTKQVKEVKKQAKAKVEHKPSKSTIDKKLVLKMFKSGKTPYQIAKALGKYYSQIAPILEKEGLIWEKRVQGPTNKRTRSVYCSDEQFKQIQQFLATAK